MTMPISSRPDAAPIRTHRVPQLVETPVTFTPVPNAYVRYAYARSADSMSSQSEGQDYLCFRHHGERLAFVVSDGVGSSFCGHLAARILGDNLLDWLWSLEVGYLGGAAALSEAATGFLNRLQKQAQREVEEYELPEQESPLIQQALEAQRAYGSEAIFAACRVDHPSPLVPKGMISLFWMGDTRVHIRDREGGAAIDIAGSWENANRWSSHKGVRGEMSAWMQPLDAVGRIVAFTDGLSGHGEGMLDYPDAKLDREIALGARLPTSDDVAFIDVVLRTPQYEGYPDPDLPDPNLERPHLEQIWNPTGVETYELRWNWHGGGRVSFIVQESTSPALTDVCAVNVPPGQTTWKPAEPPSPGHYYYRVRGVRRFGGLTPWSELRQTRVAFPPPPAPEVAVDETGSVPVLTWEGEGESLEYVVERAMTPDFKEPSVVYEGRGTAWTSPADKPGTYHLRVRAISTGGAGPWSEVQTVEVTLPPPPTPQLSSVSYGYSHGEYELRWQPVARATYYELEEVARAEDDAEPTLIRVDDTLYHVEDQPIGEYVYRVRACHDYGCGAWSGEQLAVVTPRPPDAAPELSAEGPDEDGVLHLTWTEVPNAASYVVEVSTDESFENARIVTTEERAHDLPRREPGQVLARVCGANAGGEGPWSEPVCHATPPTAPDWVEVDLVPDGEVVLVSWGAVGGRVTYRLERAAGAEGDYEKVADVKGTRQEVPPGDPSESLLRFRVRAELPGVHSAWVEARPIRVAAHPGAPRLEKPEVGPQGQVRLRWSAAAGADGYQVEVATDESFASMRAVDVDETEIDFRPPRAGRYWFRVRARHDEGGNARFDAPGDAVNVDAGRPAAPRLWPLDPVKADTPFTITWTGTPGCTFYELQAAGSEDFRPRQTDVSRVFHPEQKAALKGCPAGHAFFRVRAVIIDGGARESSPWSKTLAVEIVP